MTVRYKDYYGILGIERRADPAVIKRAFRERAKDCHPDRHPDRPDLEDRFRDINEAYEVLSDPARRAAYDALGTAHDEGEPLADDNGAGAAPRARGDFSELFTFLTRKSRPSKAMTAAASPSAAGELEAELPITLEEAVSGVTKNVTLSLTEPAAFGRTKQEERKLEIKVPPGMRDGQRLRIKGKRAGFGRGDDLYLRVRIEPHPKFSIDGDDLTTDLRVTPWEAALGATLRAPTLEGIARLKLPGGSTSGQRLRLKGHGLPRPGNPDPVDRGDLVYRIMISLPERLTPDERRLFEDLADTSDYDPRRG